MTNEEMRVAIAEIFGFCGGEITTIQDDSWCDRCGKKGNNLCHNFPNYPESLDAMHEVFKQVIAPDDALCRKYYLALVKVTLRKGSQFVMLDRIEASAHQRCEAFLRTIGEWKE